MIESPRAATYQPTVRQAEQLLPLPAGGAPQTIFVSIVPDGTTLKAGFSLTQTGTPYTDGMTWQCNCEYGLCLNFVFLSSLLGTIKEIATPVPPVGFWVSKPTIPAPLGGFNQQGCTQNVLGNYDFTVNIQPPSGPAIRVDPKIVVTPLTA